MCKDEREEQNYEVLHEEEAGMVKAWTKGVPFEDEAKNQLKKISSLPFIYKWIAAMPDVHAGKGTTVGSVIPTRGAIIPAAVGVDIGCGMMAVKTSLHANDLPDKMKGVRESIERVVPVGAASHKRAPLIAEQSWSQMEKGYELLMEKHPQIKASKNLKQLGTLGGGNHFIEICLDENQAVWLMLHSGSRGVGNRIGQYFIQLARREMERWFIHLPNRELAYFPEGSAYFNDYVLAVHWAQDYARENRELMMKLAVEAFQNTRNIPQFELVDFAVNCHHNYVELENHFGENVYVTRKGAVRARQGELGIIPGSMGAKSFIVRGKGNDQSFHSCSHGAGRTMSRTKAKQVITLEDHIESTRGVECRKDVHVLDESPKAYKDIDAVMEAQKDLVEVVHTLKQIVCIKG